MKKSISILLSAAVLISAACTGAAAGEEPETSVETESLAEEIGEAAPESEAPVEEVQETELYGGYDEESLESIWHEYNGAGRKTYVQTGITITFPEEFNDTLGVLYPYELGDMGIDYNLFVLDFYYFAMPKLDVHRYMAMDADDERLTEEIQTQLLESNTLLSEVLVLKDSITLAQLSAMTGANLEGENVTELGKANGYTYYNVVPADTSFLDGFDQEYAEEYLRLQETLNEVLKNGQFDLPELPGKYVLGTSLDFETTDVDGNPVSAKELFSQHEITMVNIWTSWCDPCIGELEELAAMNERLAELDCGVVGLLQDGDTESGLAEGRSLMEEHGVTYPVILPPENLETIFEIPAFPTSYFVDRNGVIIALPQVGAPASFENGNPYENRILELLEELQQEEETEALPEETELLRETE